MPSHVHLTLQYMYLHNNNYFDTSFCNDVAVVCLMTHQTSPYLYIAPKKHYLYCYDKLIHDEQNI